MGYPDFGVGGGAGAVHRFEGEAERFIVAIEEVAFVSLGGGACGAFDLDFGAEEGPC